ncbi:hypothetical protein Pelo_2207 [Pelomyxa schiedti]|nr:hypothetical protein Pelo_2207 [Pelomyxa schiedti]
MHPFDGSELCNSRNNKGSRCTGLPTLPDLDYLHPVNPHLHHSQPNWHTSEVPTPARQTSSPALVAPALKPLSKMPHTRGLLPSPPPPAPRHNASKPAISTTTSFGAPPGSSNGAFSPNAVHPPRLLASEVQKGHRLHATFGKASLCFVNVLHLAGVDICVGNLGIPRRSSPNLLSGNASPSTTVDTYTHNLHQLLCAYKITHVLCVSSSKSERDIPIFAPLSGTSQVQAQTTTSCQTAPTPSGTLSKISKTSFTLTKPNTPNTQLSPRPRRHSTGNTQPIPQEDNTSSSLHKSAGNVTQMSQAASSLLYNLTNALGLDLHQHSAPVASNRSEVSHHEHTNGKILAKSADSTYPGANPSNSTCKCGGVCGVCTCTSYSHTRGLHLLRVHMSHSGKGKGKLIDALPRCFDFIDGMVKGQTHSDETPLLLIHDGLPSGTNQGSVIVLAYMIAALRLRISEAVSTFKLAFHASFPEPGYLLQLLYLDKHFHSLQFHCLKPPSQKIHKHTSSHKTHTPATYTQEVSTESNSNSSSSTPSGNGISITLQRDVASSSATATATAIPTPTISSTTTSTSSTTITSTSTHSPPSLCDSVNSLPETSTYNMDFISLFKHFAETCNCQRLMQESHMQQAQRAQAQALVNNRNQSNHSKGIHLPPVTTSNCTEVTLHPAHYRSFSRHQAE